MNATELYHKDGTSAGVYYCEKCRCVGASVAAAEDCCRPNKCDRCGREVNRYHYRCDECWKLDRARQEQERFEKAEKLTEWDGWVFCDGWGESGYFESMETFMDDVEGSGPDCAPEYVWTCKPMAFVRVDMRSILSQIEDDSYDGFDAETLNGIDDLEKAIGEFNERNKDVLSYEPDFTKAVLIPKRSNVGGGSTDSDQNQPASLVDETAHANL